MKGEWKLAGITHEADFYN